MRAASAGSERTTGPRASVAFVGTGTLTSSAKTRAKSGSITAALHDPASLLRAAPPACPPSLTTRTATDAELFQFYALRGHVEVLGGSDAEEDVAVRAALGQLPPEEREALMAVRFEVSDSGTQTGRGVAGKPAPGARDAWPMPYTPSSPVAGDAEGSVTASRQHPEKDPVAPPTSVDVSQPLFPRLRPSAAEDRHDAARKRQAEKERRVELRARQEQLALPPAEAFYTTLYRPPSQLTASMEGGLQDAIHAAQAEAVAAARGSALAAVASAAIATAPASAAAASTAASVGAGGGGVHALRSGAGRPSAGYPSAAPTTSTATFASPRYSSSAVPTTAPPSRSAVDGGDVTGRQAALLRQSRSFLASEIDDVFVAAYELAHPEGRERREAQEAAARTRRSTVKASPSRAGSLAKAKKKKSVAKAAAPPREGLPAANLRFIKTSLLSACDEQGRIAGAEVERLFTGVPFDLANVDALRDLLAVIRQVTEVRQWEKESTTIPSGGGGGGIALDSSMSGASRRSNNPGMSTYSQQQQQQQQQFQLQEGSARGQGASGAFAAASGGGSQRWPTAQGVRASTSRSSVSQASNGMVSASNPNPNPNNVSFPGGAPGTSLSGVHRGPPGTASAPLPPSPSAANVAAATPAGPHLLAREVLGAMHALVNGSRTKLIVRWVCFQTLAGEGHGYIHKATLDALRRQRREECMGPHAELTASIVKALGDAFHKMAAEEEEAFLAKGQKGKRKAKAKKSVAAVKLAPNQKSVIPLGVMRRAHMDFADFCRYFDSMPQLCAAFMHVWLGTLLHGHIGPEETHGTTTATAAAAAPAAATRARRSLTLASGGTGGPENVAAAGQSSTNATRRTRVSISSQGLPSASIATEDASDKAMANEDLSAPPPVAELPSHSAAVTATQTTSGTTSGSHDVAGGASATMQMSSSAASEVKPGTFPITLLGPTAGARRAAIQSIVHKELALMREAAESLCQSGSLHPD